MARRMKIIGVCPFCHRDVGNDMRPINKLTSDKMEKLLEQMNVGGEAQPSTSGSKPTESVEGSEQVPSNLVITLDDQQISLSSSVPFTDTILNIVKTEFERPKTSDSVLTEDHAKLIVTMLTEEQHTYSAFLKSILKKKQTRRK